MDNINCLRHRNIELETELRLVKEQLAQAQCGTQYLVNCISTPSSHRYDARPNHTGGRLRQLEAENSRLRHHLSLSKNVHDDVTFDREIASVGRSEGVIAEHFQDDARVEGRSIRPSNTRKANHADLITFDAGEISPSSINWRSPADSSGGQTHAGTSLIDSPDGTPPTPFTPGHVQHGHPETEYRREPIGLGISNISPREQSIVYSPEYGHRQSHRTNDYATSHVPAGRQATPRAEIEAKTDLEEPRQWHAAASRPPSPVEPELIFSRPFMNHEHNRLLNSACFVEDMLDAEKEEHWERLANATRTHTAKEWQVYYEQVVRPAYLAKLTERSEVLHPAQITAGDNVDEEVQAEHAMDRTNQPAASPGLSASRWAPKEAEDDIGQRFGSAQPESASDTLKEGEKNSGAHAVDTVNPVSWRSDDTVIAPTTVPGSGVLPGIDIPRQDQTAHASPRPCPAYQAGEQPSFNGDMQTAFQLNPITPPYTPKANADVFNDRPTPIARQHTPFRRPPRFSSFTDEQPILHNIDFPDESLFHTVLISNIPPGITLSNILKIVGGGKIISATFLETAGLKTSPPITTNSAMVVFLGAQNAKRYVDFCHEHPITFPVGHDAASIGVDLLRTPTRPLSPALLFDMRERGLNRILFVIDAERAWTPEGVVQEILRYGNGSKRPISADRDADGVLVFEFAGVRDAAQAWNVVDQDHWYFHGASKGFLPDPCLRPLESILGNSTGAEERSAKLAATVEDADESDGASTVTDSPGSSFAATGDNGAVAETPTTSFCTSTAEAETENECDTDIVERDKDKVKGSDGPSIQANHNLEVTLNRGRFSMNPYYVDETSTST